MARPQLRVLIQRLADEASKQSHTTSLEQKAARETLYIPLIWEKLPEEKTYRARFEDIVTAVHASAVRLEDGGISIEVVIPELQALVHMIRMPDGVWTQVAK
jgi:hypothetical protein